MKSCPSSSIKTKNAKSRIRKRDDKFTHRKMLSSNLRSAKVSSDKYIDSVTFSMRSYQTIQKIDNNDIEKEEKPIFLTQEDESLIKKVYHSNHTAFLCQLTSVNEDSVLKITIPEINYTSPYHSINILNKNHLIYENIKKNSLYRQKVLFNDAIAQFESYAMKYKVKMPKIRVSKLESKASTEIPIIDTTNEDKKKCIISFPLIPTSSPKLFAYYKYPNRNFPEGREQFSLNLFENKLILSGGMSSQMKAMSLWQLSLYTVEWEKIPQVNYASSRFGHTTICHSGKLFMFGGRTKYEKSSMFIGFDIFSLHDNTWLSTVGGKTTPGFRRNHVANIIGSQMIIHGGVNEGGEVLNDCHLLNFNPVKWLVCSIDPDCYSPALFGHTAVLVLPQNISMSSKLTIYHYPDAGLVTSFNSKLKERGWYIFGGKLKEEGGLSNKLYILLLGRKPLKWIKAETNGTPPSPRYFHTMNYFDKGNFLIIHGGRNDGVSDSFALNDTYIFDLFNFDWIKIELYSQTNNFKLITRCCHSSIIYSNKLIIFGGMNSNNYLGSSLLLIHLDFSFSNSNIPKKIFFANTKRDDNDFNCDKNRLKSVLNRNQLGIITNVDLPNMK